MTLNDIAWSFVNSAEFQNKYGNPTNREFVRLIYVNVMDRNPDQSGWDYWTGQLNNGTLTRHGLLI